MRWYTSIRLHYTDPKQQKDFIRVIDADDEPAARSIADTYRRESKRTYGGPAMRTDFRSVDEHCPFCGTPLGDDPRVLTTADHGRIYHRGCQP